VRRFAVGALAAHVVEGPRSTGCACFSAYGEAAWRTVSVPHDGERFLCRARPSCSRPDQGMPLLMERARGPSGASCWA
jgi:hypothetical protein